ncbi:MAG: glycoside hydrolase family 130 protein [Halobacteriaceae archaeon]
MRPNTDRRPEYPLLPFERHPENPVIEPDPDSEWESANRYNPTVLAEDGVVKMLYRAEGPDGTSRIGYATSTDGVHFDCRPDPLIEPEHDYETPGGCEDPRLTEIDGTYYLTYTGYDGTNALLCLATSGDLETWEKHGPLFPELNGPAASGAIGALGGDNPMFADVGAFDPNAEYRWNKAGAILPEPIDGRYVMYLGVPDVWFAESRDLRHWSLGSLEDPVIPREACPYGRELVEPGPAPMLTAGGDILLVFAAYDGEQYRASQALVSGEDPTELLGMLDEPFLGPATDAAREGHVDNVVFPSGLVAHEGTVYLYFGMADSRIGVATHAP